MTSTISLDHVLEYFKIRKNRFKNSKGMEMGLIAGDEIWTYFSLTDHDYGPLASSISTEEDMASEFIELFQLKTLEDIDNLDYNHAWMRYLNGFAEITITPIELDARLNFRIMRRKTIIYSIDLHFYDEAYEHLTMGEDFERYISSHKNRLYAAEANRYKLNRNG